MRNSGTFWTPWEAKTWACVWTPGLDRLHALHLNDSKNPFASHKDRHECLGKGSLGLETFRRIVNHPQLKDKPMILETPNELPGYAGEIKILREMEA